MNPETLRELITYHWTNKSSDHEFVRAAADAWEADIDDWRRAHDLMRDAYIDKCGRLEAATKLLRTAPPTAAGVDASKWERRRINFLYPLKDREE